MDIGKEHDKCNDAVSTNPFGIAFTWVNLKPWNSGRVTCHSDRV
jgi:hypothetical protein